MTRPEVLSYIPAMSNHTDDLEAGGKQDLNTHESIDTFVPEKHNSTADLANVNLEDPSNAPGAKWKADEVHTLPPKFVSNYISHLISNLFKHQ